MQRTFIKGFMYTVIQETKDGLLKNLGNISTVKKLTTEISQKAAVDKFLKEKKIDQTQTNAYLIKPERHTETYEIPDEEIDKLISLKGKLIKINGKSVDVVAKKVEGDKNGKS